METREYFEKVMQDYNQNRNGRSLRKYCKDEAVDYNWLMEFKKTYSASKPVEQQSFISLSLEEETPKRMTWEVKVLQLRPGITGPATLKYRLEDEMIADYVAQKQKEGDTRDAQDIAVDYNDKFIYPDKVRINCYYYRHYFFIKDCQMILCTVFGKNMEYAGEVT